MMDEFLEKYEVVAGKMRPILPGTATEKLDTFLSPRAFQAYIARGALQRQQVLSGYKRHGLLPRSGRR